MKAIQTAFITAVLGVALSSTASAGIVASGSVAFGENVASYVGANLSTATSITVTTILGSFGNISFATGTPFGGGTGSTPLGSATITTPTTFLVPLSSYANFIEWGDGTGGANNTRYTFSVTASAKSNITTNDLQITAVGTFHDTLGVYNDGTASLILNFNQAGGPGNSIGGSGSIQTPQAFTLVPEPETTLLLGGALLGLGLLRRKKV
jgi:hypothetical protein